MTRGINRETNDGLNTEQMNTVGQQSKDPIDRSADRVKTYGLVPLSAPPPTQVTL